MDTNIGVPPHCTERRNCTVELEIGDAGQFENDNSIVKLTATIVFRHCIVVQQAFSLPSLNFNSGCKFSTLYSLAIPFSN
mmetsp:Transcript_3045/g.6565  ORF Transcript_3045/g.6565 Transcript_3045/m.6565 type:complete len:80 (-) Transcript_3045:13-252(-)